MSLRVLLVFTVTEFFLCLAPGPGVFLVVSQAMRNGFSASIRGTLGILTANAAFFALSAVGLGALLLASATLFEVIRWAGAAYLIVVGVRMLLGRHKTHHAQ
ncbi:MAG TPA: LysE family transporter [Blastocatellia bacterium]|nr:LysE family transporter [Blastocatellia bacterium]